MSEWKKNENERSNNENEVVKERARNLKKKEWVTEHSSRMKEVPMKMRERNNE